MNPTLAVKSVSRIIPAVLRPNDLSILVHWIDRSTPGVTDLRVLGSMVLSTMVVCLLNLGGPTSWPLCVVSSYTVPALRLLTRRLSKRNVRVNVDTSAGTRLDAAQKWQYLTAWS